MDNPMNKIIIICHGSGDELQKEISEDRIKQILSIIKREIVGNVRLLFPTAPSAKKITNIIIAAKQFANRGLEQLNLSEGGLVKIKVATEIVESNKKDGTMTTVLVMSTKACLELPDLIANKLIKKEFIGRHTMRAGDVMTVNFHWREYTMNKDIIEPAPDRNI